MSTSSSPWRRILGEGVVIIASILLALSADAWWSGRQDRARELELLRGIQTDFERTRELLVERIQLLDMLVDDGATLRDLAGAPDGRGGVQVPSRLICSATVAASLAVLPVLNTLDAALASGEISLLRSQELRESPAGWQTLLNYVSVAQERARLITEDQVLPLLSQQVALGPYFTRGTAAACDAEDTVAIRTSYQLSGAMGLRYNYHVRLQQGLPNLVARIDDILLLLAAELNESTPTT